MSSVAKEALEKHLEDDKDDVDETPDGGDASPLRDAIREAYDASKNGDADGFADAFEAALEIKLAEK